MLCFLPVIVILLLPISVSVFVKGNKNGIECNASAIAWELRLKAKYENGAICAQTVISVFNKFSFTLKRQRITVKSILQRAFSHKSKRKTRVFTNGLKYVRISDFGFGVKIGTGDCAADARLSAALLGVLSPIAPHITDKALVSVKPVFDRKAFDFIAQCDFYFSMASVIALFINNLFGRKIWKSIR